MASPDFSQYVDLTIYDEQPSEIYANAIEYAREAFPEFDFAVGGIEDALLQAAAQMTGYTAAAINRIPNAVTETFLKLYGVNRLTGTTTTGSASFTFIDSRTESIPAGTRLSYTDIAPNAPDTVYVFQTTETVSASGGVSAAIEGLTLQDYPSLQSGQSLRLLTPISFVQQVALDADLSVGTGPETDTSYFTRANTILQSYTNALTTPAQFTAYILANYPDVYRAHAVNRVNPDNPDINATPVNGYLTIYVCARDGQPLSTIDATLYDTIQQDVTNRAVAGLQIAIEDAVVVDFNIDVDISLAVDAVLADVETSIIAALDTYLHPDYWDWSTTIRYNELITLISNVTGVNYVDALTITPEGGAPVTASGNDQVFDRYGCLPLSTTTSTDINLV